MEDTFWAWIIIAFVICGIGSYWVAQQTCFSAYENYQPQFGVFSGCRIVVDGVLTPTDIVREIK